jgi:outer membrane protein OmpA-like peptidoglycan-associated protein
MLLCVTPAGAQVQSQVGATLDATSGVLTFDLSPVHLDGSNARVTVTPVLEGNEGLVTFPPVVVEGRRARISRQRMERSGRVAKDASAFYLQVNQGVRYEAVLPKGYSTAWQGAQRVSLRSVSEECGCEVKLTPQMAVRGIGVPSELSLAVVNVPNVAMPVAAVVPVEPTAPAAPQTLLEKAAAPYAFVAPLDNTVKELFTSKASPAAFDRYISEQRDGGMITVHFDVSSAAIDPAVGDNAHSLKDLLEAVKSLSNVAGSTRVHVLIAGFASPEGGTELNARLATRRAISVRDYLLARTPLTIANVRLHSAGADWQGLRALLSTSTMPGRDAALRVIDTYPVWNARTQVGRLGTLMKLNGGTTYRYMLRNFFPKLRSATFIKVLYEVD